CAAELVHQGYKVQVHEALPYPGGCVSTFYRQGYRFDTGATLPAGFGPGGVMDWVADRWGIVWDHQPAKIAMTVHISDHDPIHRYTDANAWKI
ncbi:MAG: NAD(P)-binding protein, partial [Aliifodinibius sp.]|nr:NAD(P)-binding protein [Candidatus Saccharibacteria bacterium]NIV10396.1 NAD(P)-binding protein [Fodinibius sp.]